MRLILHVGDASQSKTMSVPIQDRMVVGRGGAGEGDAPDLDFTSYNAASMGMSRNHAVFTYREDALYIEDLNSTMAHALMALRSHRSAAIACATAMNWNLAAFG